MKMKRELHKYKKIATTTLPPNGPFYPFADLGAFFIEMPPPPLLDEMCTNNYNWVIYQIKSFSYLWRRYFYVR